MRQDNCLFCGDSISFKWMDNEQARLIDCDKCGEFVISKDAEEALTGTVSEKFPFMEAIQNNDSGMLFHIYMDGGKPNWNLVNKGELKV